MSDANLGDKHPMYGKTGELCPNFGLKRSNATKQKISASTSGEKAHRATITDAIARSIKIKISEGAKNRLISEEFNTTTNVVQHIRTGKTWKHITI